MSDPLYVLGKDRLVIFTAAEIWHRMTRTERTAWMQVGGMEYVPAAHSDYSRIPLEIKSLIVDVTREANSREQ